MDEPKEIPIVCRLSFYYSPRVSHRIECAEGVEMLKYFMILDDVETAKSFSQLLINGVFFSKYLTLPIWWNCLN